MNGRKLIYILLVGTLVLALTGCVHEEQPTLVSDAESVVNRVMELADPNPPATAEPEAEATEPPAVEAFVEDEPEPTEEPETTQEPDSGEPSQGPASSEEPVDTLRPGTYTGDAGSVLTVNEDGTCTFETVLSGIVDGTELEGAVIFHGTVENGQFSFTKVTYYGLDITALAAQAGYDDAGEWETEAGELYAAK